MYQTLMVPVDLVHADTLNKAIRIAADLGKHYGAAVYLVGVTTGAPSEIAHNSKEYIEKLDQFAIAKTSEHGFQFRAKAVASHDPAAELDTALRKAGEAVGADLVIMASHVPGFMDHFFSSNAGYLAAHTDISVFVVR